MTHSTECNAPGAPLIPRGVRKSQYAKGDWFDVWLPNLAPSAASIRQTQIGYVSSLQENLKAPSAFR